MKKRYLIIGIIIAACLIYFGIKGHISKSPAQKWNPLHLTKKDTLRFDSLNQALIDSMNIKQSPKHTKDGFPILKKID